MDERCAPPQAEATSLSSASAMLLSSVGVRRSCAVSQLAPLGESWLGGESTGQDGRMLVGQRQGSQAICVRKDGRGSLAGRPPLPSSSSTILLVSSIKPCFASRGDQEVKQMRTRQDD